MSGVQRLPEGEGGCLAHYMEGGLTVRYQTDKMSEVIAGVRDSKLVGLGVLGVFGALWSIGAVFQLPSKLCHNLLTAQNHPGLTRIPVTISIIPLKYCNFPDKLAYKRFSHREVQMWHKCGSNLNS